MADLIETIERYFAAWNEPDAGRRRSLLESVYTDQGRYRDPLADASGWEAINDNIVAVQQQFPDHRFQRVSEVDVHHDSARFDWELADPSGSTVIGGVDYVQVGEDGRLRHVTGFFGATSRLS
jgi:hypothetical protein